MPEKQTHHANALTSPQAVALGQDVYDRIISGTCTDVRTELDAAYGFIGAHT